jgi:hypothetical protein
MNASASSRETVGKARDGVRLDDHDLERRTESVLPQQCRHGR